MATNLLVTGSHGGDDPHVESKHDALMHAAMLGRSGYILKTRNWTMKPTAKDANNITIPAWDLVVEGRQIYIAAPTDVNIQSGSQGQKRRDLIVARYALNSGTGVETVTLEAIKGKPSAATPADPGIETGSIIGGAIVSDLPLCRVNLDGITITSIDTLVNVMQPLEDVWDSLTPLHLYTGSSVLYDAGSGGYATLWTFSQFRQQFGRDWGDDVCISAMNGDWDANGRQVTSVRVTRSGNRIDVMFDGKNTAHTRVNWAVMWRG